MDLLTNDELKTLLENQNKSSVSIFMPTYRTGRETQQNRIRLKNLLAEAEAGLTANGLRAPEARRLLEPAQSLLNDDDFWQHQSDGLALYLSPDLFRSYRLPAEFDELVVVTDRFHLKPLLPLLSGDGRFYILALSQNKVRVLRGTRYRIREMEPEGIPQGLAEALQYDEFRKQQQFHTKSAPGPGGRQAIFHGQGGSTADEKKIILRYFQQIDKGLKDFLQTQEVPIVLAGVEYLHPIYREANSYPHLIDGGVTGNPEEMSAEELHERAWAIVKPYFEQAQQEAMRRYRQLSDTDQISGDIREIVPAAYYGKVETLFVALENHQWGSFDPDSNTINLRQEAAPGDEDLLDSAAVQTLLYGGTVYAMGSEKMPDETRLAAVFRYS